MVKLEPYQYEATRILNPDSDIRALGLFWPTGSGKTIGALSVADQFIRHNLDMANMFEESYKIVVLLKNTNLRINFENEIDHFYGSQHCRSMRKFFHISTVTSYFSDRTEGIHENALIIIDEAHNFAKGAQSSKIVDVLQTTKKTKMLLLSATPIFDNVKEIFFWANLLNFDQGAIYSSATINKLVEKLPCEDIGVKGAAVSIKDSEYETLCSHFRGRVHFASINRENYPTHAVHNVEATMAEVQNKEYKALFTKCFPFRVATPSSTEQSLVAPGCVEKDAFERGALLTQFKALAQKKTVIDDICDGLSSLSLNKASVISDDEEDEEDEDDVAERVYASADYMALASVSNSSSNLGIKTFSQLQHVAAKIAKALFYIDQNEGPHFLFSNKVSKSGIAFCKEYLSHNSYVDVSDRLKVNAAFTKEEVQSIIDNLKKRGLRGFLCFNTDNKITRAHYKRLINHPLNCNGGLVHLVIGSKAISEGLTLLCMRSVHILDPWWNESVHLQVQGRAIRNHSHDRLPQEKRHVDIFRYAATSVTHESYDKMVYDVCRMKFEYNEMCMNAIKENCCEYEYFNTISTELPDVDILNTASYYGRHLSYNSLTRTYEALTGRKMTMPSTLYFRGKTLPKFGELYKTHSSGILGSGPACRASAAPDLSCVPETVQIFVYRDEINTYVVDRIRFNESSTDRRMKPRGRNIFTMSIADLIMILDYLQVTEMRIKQLTICGKKSESLANEIIRIMEAQGHLYSKEPETGKLIQCRKLF